jgi:hypothetical protein
MLEEQKDGEEERSETIGRHIANLLGDISAFNENRTICVQVPIKTWKCLWDFYPAILLPH